MPLTAFITICILGIDFMVYVLFQWTFGDKRRAIARKISSLRTQPNSSPAHPYLVTFRNRGNSGSPRSSAA